jgi:TetR/AcrR family transcriptional regulator
MDIKLEQHTEEKILEAAKNIFLKRGYFGTRMQDIADEAKINKALLHYYFRNKDKLFEKIFVEAFGKIYYTAMSTLSMDIPFIEKIGLFIDKYIDIICENQYLPAFIIHEMSHNPEHLEEVFSNHFAEIPTAFIGQINEEIKASRIKPIDPRQLIINILSLCIFPILAKPLMM